MNLSTGASILFFFFFSSGFSRGSQNGFDGLDGLNGLDGSPALAAVQFPLLDVPGLIQFWGYQVENHWATTDDGYILNLHRIPGKSADSPLVFLQHGLLGSSARFVTGPPEKSLAYILSDLGYDVWLGNIRGNTYSRNHTTLDPDTSKEFWDFDFEDVGMSDLPASLDYALANTNQARLIYVGHSMGATSFLAGASLKPDLQDRLSSVFLMAPPAFMGHAQGLLAQAAPYSHWLEILLGRLGIYEILPHTNLTSVFGHAYCDEAHIEAHRDLCRRLATSMLLISESQLNETMLPVLFDVFPEGSSLRPFLHYAQLMTAPDEFNRFDYYSRWANQLHYGQSRPPSFDLQAIDVPVHIFYGDGDAMVAKEDVLLLTDTLPSVPLSYEVPLKGWNHNDFVYGVDAPDLVYSVMVNCMKGDCDSGKKEEDLPNIGVVY